MIRNALLLALAPVLVLSGCSFIDDWGSITTTSGMDAGPGIDAGPSCTDQCDPDAMGSCDAPEVCALAGTGCFECAMCGGCDPASCAGTCDLVPGTDACTCNVGNFEGEGCSGDDDCRSELFCVAETCVRECDVDGDCTADYPYCNTLTEPGRRLCTDLECDPREPACGPLGELCMIDAIDGELSSIDCYTPDLTRPEGSFCDSPDVCGAGLVCVTTDPAEPAHCQRVCFNGDPSSCESSDECRALRWDDGSDATLPDGTTLGFCLLSDGDGDGDYVPLDCDDTDPSRGPIQGEVDCLDGIDNDCNTFTDANDWDCQTCTTDDECGAGRCANSSCARWWRLCDQFFRYCEGMTGTIDSLSTCNDRFFTATSDELDCMATAIGRAEVVPGGFCPMIGAPSGGCF